MKKRISELEKTIASLIEYTKEVNQSISAGFSKASNNFEILNKQIKKIDADLIIINAKISKLEGSTNRSLKKVDVKLDNLKTEIKNINKITGYDGMINNLKVVGK